jgi:small-conductance mechanosensitive channel
MTEFDLGDWIERYILVPLQENALMALLGLAALTLLASLAFWVLRFLFNRVEARVTSWQGTRLRALRFQRQEFLSDEDTTNLVRGLVRALRYTAYFLTVYVYLQVVFLLMPGTRPLGEGLLDYVTGILFAMARSVVDYVPSLLFLVILFFVARYAIRFTEMVFRGIASKRIRLRGFDPQWAKPTFRLARLLLWAFFLVVAFPYLPGSGSPAFQGVSIFLGVLLSLGGSGAVANMVSGTVLTYMNAFDLGDRVKIADAVGDVVERRLFVTRLRTVKNVDISIPNAMVMANHIINYSSQAAADGVLLHTTVTIGYDAPWPKVHELLIQAAKETPGLEKDREPFVLQTALDDFYVAYELNVTTREPTRMQAIYSELHQNIQDAFNAAAMEIASPHMSAVRDGNPMNIPDDYLPKDYQPPAFRLFKLGGVGGGVKEAPEGAP